MKDLKLEDLLQYLQGHETEVRLASMIALAVFVLILIIYLVRVALRSDAKQAPKPAQRVQATRTTPPPEEEEEPAPVVVAEAPKPAPQAQPVQAPAAVVAKPISVAPPKAPLAFGSHVPQESVLRRHFVTHVRTLLETVSAPRPTECVLRRHYEQLISSQLEEILQDETKWQKLQARYDEHRKNAVNKLAA